MKIVRRTTSSAVDFSFVELMPPNHPVAVFHNGRKFFVTHDESERIRNEKRNQRRTETQKPVKMSNLPASIPRTVLNPVEQQKAKVLRVPIVRREQSARPSRSILKVVDDRDDETKANRAHSSDRILDNRQSTPIEPTENDEIKRSSSAEILQTSSTRRAVPTGVVDYGTTPTNQTYSQSNASKLTSYFLRMKPSSSIIETGVFGEDRIYTVIGSTNRRSNQNVGDAASSSSISNNNNNEFYSRDAASGSFSDESATSLLMLVQRRNNEIQRQKRHDYSTDTSNSPIQSKESWIESSTRSQFTDVSYEKKRVRFADMEGFTLETSQKKTLHRTPTTNSLLTRRKQLQVTNPIRGQTTRPVFNTFYQAIAGVGGGFNRRSKLVTDV